MRKFCFHDLRHTYTVLLIAQGVNIKFIQSQLGHASIQTTLDRYGHFLSVTQQGMGSCIDQQIFFQLPTITDQDPSVSVALVQRK